MQQGYRVIDLLGPRSLAAVATLARDVPAPAAAEPAAYRPAWRETFGEIDRLMRQRPAGPAPRRP